MKHQFIYITLIGIAFTIKSCYKDKGNYTYSAPETISISGLEDTYTKISLKDSLFITPQVEGSDPTAEFEYFWLSYEVVTATGLRAKADTIARTKNLEHPIRWSAGARVLIFNATNKKTGFAKQEYANLVIATEFTRGWYVLKDDGTNTDLDLFQTHSSIIPSAKLEDVFSLMNNNRKLQGKSGHLSFGTSYKSNITGVYNNTRTLFCTSERDLSVVSLNSMEEIRDYTNTFYEVPINRKPSHFTLGISSYYLFNDGLLHGNGYLASGNTGQFGSPILRDDSNSPYRLSKYYVSGVINNPVFFDELSSSFVGTTANATIMLKAIDAPASTMSATNNNKTILFWGLKTVSPYLGWAVLQDKTDPSIKHLCSVRAALSGVSLTLTLLPEQISPSSKLYNASIHTALYGDENLLYFVTGNEVWSRNLANNTETLQYKIPDGETVSYLRHRKYTGSAQAELPYYYNFIIVGTNSATGYKVRMFTKSSGNLSPEPSVVLEGKGNMTDVLYIAPNISESTYQLSF